MQGELLSIYRFLQGFALVAAAALALSVASGCGGSDSGATADSGVTAESGSLSKTEFIAKADSLCKKTHAEFLKETSQYLAEANPSSKAEEKEALGELVEDLVLPTYEKLIDEIGALVAPSADTKEVTKFLDALQSRLAEIEDKPVELTETTTPFRAVGKLAAAYGLNGCAQTFS